MTDVTVHLRYARIAPRKARLVADLIRGKSVRFAEPQLTFSGKKAGRFIGKLLKAGLSAAKAKKLDADKLTVSRIVVQEGPRLQRARPHFRGIVRPIDKQMSHITLVLTDERMENGKLKMEKKNVGISSEAAHGK